MFSNCAPSTAVKLESSVIWDTAIVLFVKVWLPDNVATVESIAISFALAVIPVPPITFKVAAPLVAPPVKPVPAATSVISPLVVSITVSKIK